MITECSLCCQHRLRYLLCGSQPGALLPPRGQSAMSRHNLVSQCELLAPCGENPVMLVNTLPCTQESLLQRIIPPHVNYIPILWMKKLSLGNVK